VARHEGALQERFAMSRSTRDLWARFKILMAAVSDLQLPFPQPETPAECEKWSATSPRQSHAKEIFMFAQFMGHFPAGTDIQ